MAGVQVPPGALEPRLAQEPAPAPGPLPLSPPRQRGRRRSAIIAIAIVLVVTGAGVASNEIYQATRPAASPYPAPPPGWGTFKTAWNAVSGAFRPFANGSWTISFAEGAAADGPWSPPALLWALYGTSYTSCEEQLSGISTITFWNASAYPYSDSPNVFLSGAAPLWTFIFNGTGTLTFVVTWDRGNLVLNGALGPDSSCMNTPLFNPGYWPIQPSAELDSNAIAWQVAAYDRLIPPTSLEPMPEPPNPAFALYFPGQELLPSTIEGGNLWTVAYGACGLPGQLGVVSDTYSYLLNATSLQTGNSYSFMTGSGRQACYDTLYQVLFNQSQIVVPLTPAGLYHEWFLNATFFSSAVPATWTISDLTTSLLPYQVLPPFTGGAQPPLPSAAALCGPGTANASSCPTPTQGWYLVLLSHTGQWMDSYPSVANGTSWTIPAVPVSTGDRLLLVSAAPLPQNDTLEAPGIGGEPAIETGTPV